MGVFSEVQLKEVEEILDASDANNDGVFNLSEQDKFVDMLIASKTAPYATVQAAATAFWKGLADTDNDGTFTKKEVIDFFTAFEG